MRALRVLVVDDNPLLSAALARLVETHPRFAVVGVASNGREALQQVERLQPDLVLLDLGLPDMSGLEVARQLKAQTTAPYVILLTLEDAAPYQSAASSSGAEACLAKTEVGTELLPLIERLVTLGTSGGAA